MEKAYKFRIYPNLEQQTLINKTFGCVRFVYNYYLNKREVTYKTDGKTMGHNACSNDLTRLKKELLWLKEPDSIALQVTLENLQDAYERFFQAYKRGDTNWGKPSFKSKKNNHKSYTTKCVICTAA